MIAIKHRFTGAIICEFGVETVRQAVEQGKANLCGVNLRGVNLREANLRGADLCGANLCWADLCEANLREANLCGADLCGANLCGADLRGANLRWANLRWANLRWADLCEANLYGANLYGAKIDDEEIIKAPLSMTGLRYWCLITEGFMRLGCKRFTHEEWGAFTDEQISEMDEYALEFWKQWREPLLAMCAAQRGVK